MDHPETEQGLSEAAQPLSDEMPDFSAAHMETFRAPDLDGGGGGEDDVVALNEDGQPVDMIDTGEAVELMSKDAFFVVFRHGFGLPGMFSPTWKPLAIQPEETQIARDACDAIYELLEIYFPAALLPQGDTIARLMTAGPFIIAKVMVVRMILAAQRQEKIAPKRPASDPAPEFKSARTEAPANDNAEPAEYVDPVGWIGQEAA